MNEITFFESQVSNQQKKVLAKITNPVQIARNMQLAIDLAYATKAERIRQAKLECELRRQRKAAKTAKITTEP